MSYFITGPKKNHSIHSVNGQIGSEIFYFINAFLADKSTVCLALSYSRMTRNLMNCDRAMIIHEGIKNKEYIFMRPGDRYEEILEYLKGGYFSSVRMSEL